MQAVDTFAAFVKNTLQEGGEVRVSGLGVFEVTDRKARTARNTQTGEMIDIEAARVPTFKSDTEFKDFLNGT